MIYSYKTNRALSELLDIPLDLSERLSDQHLSLLDPETLCAVPNVFSEEMKQVYRENTLKQFADPEKRERHRKACKPHSDKIWINNGNKNKRVLPGDFEEIFSKMGYIRGRLFDRSKAFWDYDKRGANNPFFGKTHQGDMKRFSPKTSRRSS